MSLPAAQKTSVGSFGGMPVAACQGRRRLELFGEDTNIRRGWLTLGSSLSSSNFDPSTWYRNFEGTVESNNFDDEVPALPLTPTRPSHPRLHTLVFTLSSSLPPAASPPSSLARRSSHFHCQPPPPSSQSNVHRWPSCYPTTCSARHLSSSRSAPNRAVPAHLQIGRASCRERV